MENNYKEILTLSKLLMSKDKLNANGNFSLQGKEVSKEALNQTLANQLKNFTHTDGKFDMYKYAQNKNLIFQLLSETLTDVLPKKVLDTYGAFADIRHVPQGDTVVFRHKIGQQRAKQFITRVGLAGRYEVFELAEETFKIQTTAYGGAARIGIEEFLDGRVQWSDYLDIVNEGMGDKIYEEIEKALSLAIAKFPATNKVASATFDESQFDRLIDTVSVYGSPVIYCTLEAARTIIPNTYWVSDAMKNDRWNKGYFASYKTTPVIIMPQSFTDQTNSQKVIDPQMIYIFPTGNEKPIKVVIEGSTLVKDFENRDWSSEMQTYQKFGIAVMNTNNLAVFKNTSLTKQNKPGSWS